MSKRGKVRVGTVKDMGQRFVSAWHRLERGEKVRERHVTFPDLPSMLNALTPKRLELLGQFWDSAVVTLRDIR